MKEQKDEQVYYQYPARSKSNYLIGAKYKASLLELKTMYAALLKIQEGKYHEEYDGFHVDISGAELADLFNIQKSGGLYKNLKVASKHMMNKSYGMESDETQEFRYYNLINGAEFVNGIFQISFNKAMKEYIMNLEKNFTPLKPEIMLKFSSEYSFRLYEIIKKSCYYPKNFNGTRNGKFRFDISVSELKLSIGVVNSELQAVQDELTKSDKPNYDKAVEKSPEQMYRNWADFRKRCLDIPLKEINEKTDLEVSYDTLKSGKGGKVYAVRFNVYVEALDNTEKTEQSYNEIDVPTAVDEDGISSIQLSDDEKFVLWMETAKIFEKENIGFTNIQTLCETAGYDIIKIKRAKSLLDLQHGKIDNVVGWLISCIKDNYKVPLSKEPAKQKSTNKFNDFHQREYDGDELEKIMLNL